MAPGLARRKADFVALEIDILPSQPRQIAEPLSGVKAKKNEAFPLTTGHCQDALQFRQRESATDSWYGTLDVFDGLNRVFRKKTIFFRALKHHAQKFDFMIHGRRADSLEFGFAIRENIGL